MNLVSKLPALGVHKFTVYYAYDVCAACWLHWHCNITQLTYFCAFVFHFMITDWIDQLN